jgi:hypothetical protein
MLKIEFNDGRHDDLIEEQAYRGAEVVSVGAGTGKAPQLLLLQPSTGQLELAASSTSAAVDFAVPSRNLVREKAHK